MKKNIFYLIFVIFTFFVWGTYCAAEEIQIQIAADKARLTFQVIDDSRILVSAKDAGNNPIRGLKTEDSPGDHQRHPVEHRAGY
jgi:hypothetical protein